MIFEFIFSLNFLYIILTVILGYVIYYYAFIFLEKLQGQRPPGPWGLPYVGAIPYMEMEFHKALTRLGNVYGHCYQVSSTLHGPTGELVDRDVSKVDLGVNKTVVLDEPETVRQLFKLPALNGRADDLATKNYIEDGWGLFFRDGDRGWRLMRKNGIKALALFSSAKNAGLTAAAARATDAFKQDLDKKEGQPLDIREDMFKLTGTVVMSLFFGRDADPDDPDMDRVYKYTSNLLDEMMELMILSMLPLLKPFYYNTLKKQYEGSKTFTAYIWTLISQHSFTGDVVTIADATKKSAIEITDEELAEAKIKRENLELLAIDLYAAGMFDTAENSHWFLVLLAAHPEYQERMLGEIMDVTGGSRHVESADQSAMVFSHACLLESLRYACTAPIAMPHRTMEPVQLKGYTIPKGVDVIGNVWSIHMNPEYFPEPQKYNPMRFIKNGKINSEVVNNIMVFGAGGRRCIGEGFAKQEIFVVCLNIIQDFRVELDPDTPGNPMEHGFRMTLQPGPHKLIFHRR